MSNYKGTLLDGVELYSYVAYSDDRGYFAETYNQNDLNSLLGHHQTFIQDNESFSKKNVIRGLHYQKGKTSQSKLIRCLAGVINDVIVDLRNSSPTFGKHMIVELSQNKIVYIPRGFAHGFSVLSDYALIQYKVDNYYNKENETGIIYNDSFLNIDWGIDINDVIISEHDLNLPSFDMRNVYF
jgi:dTDP-4-dehydrorhamnose 3,5-epimerase